MSRDTFSLRLKSAKMISRTVRHLAFEMADDSLFCFEPGQFITFHFELGGETFQRSYSIASIPTQTREIEIAVSPFEGGPGTKLLFGIQPGDCVETSGPFGRLVLREEHPKRYFLVATGTGVTPYRCMLPSLIERIQNDQAQAIILQGVQTPEDLLYGDDFVRYADSHSGLEFHAFYSRKMPDAPQAHEHKGYVQNFFDNIQLDPEHDVIYLCGNPDMIDDSFKIFRDREFATSQIRREKYISPKKRG